MVGDGVGCECCSNVCMGGVWMSHEPLPDRRVLIRQAVKVGGKRVYLDVGFYEDGRVGELFLAVEQTGSERRWLYDETARSNSKLLQWGCPLGEIVDGWVGSKGAPFGPVQGDSRIKNCTSILDYCGRYLGVYFCDRDDLSHVQKPTEAAS